MAKESRETLRRARPSDLHRLLPLMAAFNRAEGLPFDGARVGVGLARLLRSRRLGVVVLAESTADGDLGGYAIGTFGFDLEFAGPDSFLTELFVQPDRRRSGLGRRLLEAVMATLRDDGARAVTLLVWPENTAARRLYASVGFKELRRVAMVRRLKARPQPRKVNRSKT